MVSIAAIAMSNYQMVYGGNDAAQTDNKFGVWFNVQRNPNMWHFLWKWTISKLLILNMNIPLVPIESICGSTLHGDHYSFGPRDGWLPKRAMAGHLQKGSEGHEAGHSEHFSASFVRVAVEPHGPHFLFEGAGGPHVWHIISAVADLWWVPYPMAAIGTTECLVLRVRR